MKIYLNGLAAFFVLCILPNCASSRHNESLDNRISKLVNQTTESARLEVKAFEELESLGTNAVPYLVGHLGDVRPLAKRSISFTNMAPGAFEGKREYTPVTVHDALAAILNQVTGESFVFVYNGATPQEREENRKKWIVWCQSKFPNHVEVCNRNSKNAPE